MKPHYFLLLSGLALVSCGSQTPSSSNAASSSASSSPSILSSAVSSSMEVVSSEAEVSSAAPTEESSSHEAQSVDVAFEGTDFYQPASGTGYSDEIDEVAKGGLTLQAYYCCKGSQKDLQGTAHDVIQMKKGVSYMSCASFAGSVTLTYLDKGQYTATPSAYVYQGGAKAAVNAAPVSDGTFFTLTFETSSGFMIEDASSYALYATSLHLQGTI